MPRSPVPFECLESFFMKLTPSKQTRVVSWFKEYPCTPLALTECMLSTHVGASDLAHVELQRARHSQHADCLHQQHTLVHVWGCVCSQLQHERDDPPPPSNNSLQQHLDGCNVRPVRASAFRHAIQWCTAHTHSCLPICLFAHNMNVCPGQPAPSRLHKPHMLAWRALAEAGTLPSPPHQRLHICSSILGGGVTPTPA